MERNPWGSAVNDQSRLDDFQFHFAQQAAPEIPDFDEHSSSSAIAYLRLPPVHPPSPTNIFLANFPKSWGEYDLAQIFDGIPILTVHVIRDKIAPNAGGGLSRGVGFVNVLYKHEAVALVQHLDRKIWLDVEAPLKIRLAKASAPNPKVEVDVNGMIDSSARQTDGEFHPARRPGPTVNLLKELEIAISLAKRPPQSSPSFPTSPSVPAGLYNLWEPMVCNVKSHSSGWSFYTQLEPTRFPHQVNHFRPAIHPRTAYDVKRIPEAYPNQWASWQCTQDPIQPTIFDHCPPMRCNPYSTGFRKSATHHTIRTPPAPESQASSSSSPGSTCDYGFIGGPAVDLRSGAVISPRRHQLTSSPTSSEESIPPPI